MRKILLAFLICLVMIASSGCSGKSGALEDPVSPLSYVAPTIANLQVGSGAISKCTGGILRVNSEWASPRVVSTATAYLAFVKTIQEVNTEPVGVIGSGTSDLQGGVLAQVIAPVASDAACLTSDAAAFYRRFSQPIAIPTKVGTDKLSGMWSADIPMPKDDIADAPLGIHQMLFYMSINGQKTNTLSFEITFSQ